MGIGTKKQTRILELFYRMMRGESVSPQRLANEYEVSTKSITRDINEIKAYLAERGDVIGKAELKYDSSTKTYHLEFEDSLQSKELFAIIKVLVGARSFSKMELLEIVEKLKHFTSRHDGKIIEKLLIAEMYNYQEVKNECSSVIDNLWKLTNCIENQKEITVDYVKMDTSKVERRLIPLAIMFSEYYFYLIAIRKGEEEKGAGYFRVDRITKIVEHRENFTLEHRDRFDEGDLRNHIHFMFPGKSRKIRFEFSGPSLQAILDKIPTARVVEKKKDVSILEAEVYGTGIHMVLLSQGSWVKVLEPADFVDEMREEIRKMGERYEEIVL